MNVAPTAAAPTRHVIADVLDARPDIADRRDLASAVGPSAATRVRFPADGFGEPAGAAAFFTRLWLSTVPHRHHLSGLIVGPDGRATGTRP